MKEELKKKGHKTSGKKEELIKRMSEPVPSDNESESDNDDSTDYKKWTVKKIKQELKTRGIKSKVGDKKDDLIDRLTDDDNSLSDKHVSDSDSDSESDLDSDDVLGVRTMTVTGVVQTQTQTPKRNLNERSLLGLRRRMGNGDRKI